jgi:hypothetical protein
MFIFEWWMNECMRGRPFRPLHRDVVVYCASLFCYSLSNPALRMKRRILNMGTSKLSLNDDQSLEIVSWNIHVLSEIYPIFPDCIWHTISLLPNMEYSCHRNTRLQKHNYELKLQSLVSLATCLSYVYIVNASDKEMHSPTTEAPVSCTRQCWRVG